MTDYAKIMEWKDRADEGNALFAEVIAEVERLRARNLTLERLAEENATRTGAAFGIIDSNVEQSQRVMRLERLREAVEAWARNITSPINNWADNPDFDMLDALFGEGSYSRTNSHPCRDLPTIFDKDEPPARPPVRMGKCIAMHYRTGSQQDAHPAGPLCVAWVAVEPPVTVQEVYGGEPRTIRLSDYEAACRNLAHAEQLAESWHRTSDVYHDQWAACRGLYLEARALLAKWRDAHLTHDNNSILIEAEWATDLIHQTDAQLGDRPHELEVLSPFMSAQSVWQDKNPNACPRCHSHTPNPACPDCCPENDKHTAAQVTDDPTPASRCALSGTIPTHAVWMTKRGGRVTCECGALIPLLARKYDVAGPGGTMLADHDRWLAPNERTSSEEAVYEVGYADGLRELEDYKALVESEIGKLPSDGAAIRRYTRNLLARIYMLCDETPMTHDGGPTDNIGEIMDLIDQAYVDLHDMKPQSEAPSAGYCSATSHHWKSSHQRDADCVDWFPERQPTIPYGQSIFPSTGSDETLIPEPTIPMVEGLSKEDWSTITRAFFFASHEVDLFNADPTHELNRTTNAEVRKAAVLLRQILHRMRTEASESPTRVATSKEPEAEPQGGDKATQRAERAREATLTEGTVGHWIAGGLPILDEDDPRHPSHHVTIADLDDWDR